MSSVRRLIPILAGLVCLISSPSALAVKKEVALGSAPQNANQTFVVSWTDPQTKETVTKEEQSNDKGIIYFDFSRDGTYTFTNKDTKEEHTVVFSGGVVTVARKDAPFGGQGRGSGLFGGGTLFFGGGIEMFNWDHVNGINDELEQSFKQAVPDGTYSSNVDDSGAGVFLNFGVEWQLFYKEKKDKIKNLPFFFGTKIGIGTVPDTSVSYKFNFTDPSSGGPARVDSKLTLNGKTRAGIELYGRWAVDNNWSLGLFTRYEKYWIDVEEKGAIQVMIAPMEYMTVESFSEKHEVNDNVWSGGIFAGRSFGGNTPGNPYPWLAKIFLMLSDINGANAYTVGLSVEKPFGGPAYVGP